VPERPLDPTVEKIRQALQASDTAQAFLNALEDRGLMLTYATPDEARRSERVAAFAKELDRYARKLTEGELLVIDERGRLFRLDARTIGEDVRVRASASTAPWMGMKGGVAGLSDEHLASAQRSYDAWAAQKPELAARHDFADYVSYVQKQWAENEHHRPGVRELDLGSVDRASLLSVTAAREAMQEAARETWKAERAAEREQARPASQIESRIADIADQAARLGATVLVDATGRRVDRVEALADQLQPDGERQTNTVTVHGREAFAARLEDAGIAIVRVTETDTKALAALREQEEFDRASGLAYKPRHFADLVVGDLAAVTRQGDVHRINPDKFSDAKRFLDLAGDLPGVVETRARFEIEGEKISAVWDQRRAAGAERDAAYEGDRALHDTVNAGERGVENTLHAADDAVNAGLDATSGAAGFLAKAIEKVLAVFSLFVGGEPKLTPQQARDQARADTNEETLHARAYAASEQEKEIAAGERIFELVRQQRQDKHREDMGLSDTPTAQRKARDDYDGGYERDQ